MMNKNLFNFQAFPFLSFFCCCSLIVNSHSTITDDTSTVRIQSLLYSYLYVWTFGYEERERERKNYNILMKYDKFFVLFYKIIYKKKLKMNVCEGDEWLDSFNLILIWLFLREREKESQLCVYFLILIFNRVYIYLPL